MRIELAACTLLLCFGPMQTADIPAWFLLSGTLTNSSALEEMQIGTHSSPAGTAILGAIGFKALQIGCASQLMWTRTVSWI